MAYEKHLNDGKSSITTERRGPFAQLKKPRIEQPRIHFYELEASEVLDVIHNDEHPLFESYTDIGKIKARKVNSQFDVPIGDLLWIKPMDSNIKELPVIGEFVVIATYMGEEYYTNKIGIFNSPNHNVLPGLTLSTGPAGDKAATANDYTIHGAGGTPTSEEESDFLYDQLESFDEDTDVRPLRQYAGDITIEGRFGNSIRFGSNHRKGIHSSNDSSDNYVSPNVKIQAGLQMDAPVKEQQFAKPVDEDINEDGSCVWLTTDEKVTLEPGSSAATTHYENFAPPSEYKGKQIHLNSDRLIFNSKQEETIVFSKKDIYCNTQAEFIVDADEKIILNTPGPSLINSNGRMDLVTQDKTVIESPNIYLGDDGADEPVVLGNKLLDIMNQLCDGIRACMWVNGAGPAGLAPGSDAMITAAQNQFQTYLSKQNFSK